MFRSTPTRCGLFLAVVLLLSACGSSGDDDGDDMSSPETEDTAPTTTDTSTEPDGHDVDAGSGDHPLEGSWLGEVYEDGVQPQIEIYANGDLSVDSGGFVCNGDARALPDETYLLTITDCMVPVPPGTATLSDDGTTLDVEFPDGESETWQRSS